MTDIVMTDRQQDDLRRLLTLDSVSGSLPSEHLLQIIVGLIPCDCLEIDLADRTGYVVDSVALTSGPVGGDGPACDGPLMLGLVHRDRHPVERELLRRLSLADGLTLGVRCGPDHVAQLSLDRHTRTFSERDVAVLRMISPALQRLLRTHRTVVLPVSLTESERRVLQLVATGASNSDIASDLYVSVATVRKHLEHTYRKLGVRNRMAAVVAFGAGPATADEGGAELVDEYA